MDGSLTGVELKLIELFVNASKALGLPKSVGEIYGIVFASTDPCSMEEIMNRLGLSLGSTSQGLKVLRSFGAVKTVYTPGKRKDLYVAELDFRKIITQYLTDVLLPQFSESKSHLEDLEFLAMEEGTEVAHVIRERIKILAKVSTRLNLVLPAFAKISKL